MTNIKHQRPPDKVDDTLSRSWADRFIMDHDDFITWQQLTLWRTPYKQTDGHFWRNRCNSRVSMLTCSRVKMLKHPGVHGILWQTSDHCGWTEGDLLHLAWQSEPQQASRFPPQSRIRGLGLVSSPPDEVQGEPRPGGPLPGNCSATLGWNKQDKQDPSDKTMFTETRCNQTYLRPPTSSEGLWGLYIVLIFPVWR